jgi:hypothetical protein
VVSYVSNSAKEGDFFSSGGNNSIGLQAQLENANQGRLVVGIARKRSTTQQGQTGSGKIGQIKFKVLAKNKSDIKFVSNELKDFQENKISAAWIGGEIGGD